MGQYEEPETPKPAWQIRKETALDLARAARARVIRKQGYCKGCGSKVRRKLAERHVTACSFASWNHEVH